MLSQQAQDFGRSAPDPYPMCVKVGSGNETTVDTTQTSKTFLFWFTRSKPLYLYLRRLLDT